MWRPREDASDSDAGAGSRCRCSRRASGTRWCGGPCCRAACRTRTLHEPRRTPRPVGRRGVSGSPGGSPFAGADTSVLPPGLSENGQENPAIALWRPFWTRLARWPGGGGSPASLLRASRPFLEHWRVELERGAWPATPSTNSPGGRGGHQQQPGRWLDETSATRPTPDETSPLLVHVGSGGCEPTYRSVSGGREGRRHCRTALRWRAASWRCPSPMRGRTSRTSGSRCDAWRLISRRADGKTAAEAGGENSEREHVVTSKGERQAGASFRRPRDRAGTKGRPSVALRTARCDDGRQSTVFAGLPSGLREGRIRPGAGERRV